MVIAKHSAKGKCVKKAFFFTFAILNNGARENVTNFGQKTVWTEDDWELHYYWVASVAIPVGKGVKFLCFLCLFFFFVLLKVLPLTPLLSGVLVHRVFCAYFLRIERVVEMLRFLWWTQ